MKEYANWKEIAKRIANMNKAIAGTQGPKKGLTDEAIMLCKLNKSL